MTNSGNHNNQQLNNLVQRMSDQEQRYQSKKHDSEAEWNKAELLAIKLWEKMVQMYGHKFLSQFGETANETWVRCLKGITGQQVASGLEKCLTHCPEWPPGAAQFRALCLGLDVDDKGREIARRAGMYDTRPTQNMINRMKELPVSDEHKSRRRKLAEQTIDELRGMFD